MARLKKLYPRNTDERYVAAAKALYNEEGILEVDDGALVSYSEEGAYVQAWVWVDDSDIARMSDMFEQRRNHDASSRPV